MQGFSFIMKFIIFFVPFVYTELHTFTTFYTGINGQTIAGIPEISSVTTLDGRQIDYYDSEIKKLIPRQDWMKEFTSTDRWKEYTEIREQVQQANKINITVLMERFNHLHAPEVSVLQRNSSSPVVCHATGFYPSAVTITWLRNGDELDEDVEFGDLLPNEDGTFQKKAIFRVTPDEWKKNEYFCVVEHEGSAIWKTKDELYELKYELEDCQNEK